MTTEELKRRTKQFAVEVIRLAESLPANKATDVVRKQLIRAATSVGANYRAACRARSKADFISKITTVEEESDECTYWLELLQELKSGNQARIEMLHKEADELTAIFTASGRTAKSRRDQ